jgi:uncharacterized protein
MPRPCKPRRIGEMPRIAVFRPGDGRSGDHDPIRLTLDEYEALRLADHLNLYQDEAAKRMSVSRQTFGSIIASARSKTAGALVQGRAIRIDQGPSDPQQCHFLCSDCGTVWSAGADNESACGCPRCRRGSLPGNDVFSPSGKRRCRRRSGECERKDQ